MKAVIHIVSAAALAISFNVGVFTSASAEDGKSDLSELCKSWVDSGRFDSVGACMKYINVERGVDVCKELWDDPRYQRRYGWKNQGACVSWLQERRNQ